MSFISNFCSVVVIFTVCIPNVLSQVQVKNVPVAILCLESQKFKVQERGNFAAPDSARGSFIANSPDSRLLGDESDYEHSGSVVASVEDSPSFLDISGKSPSSVIDIAGKSPSSIIDIAGKSPSSEGLLAHSTSPIV